MMHSADSRVAGVRPSFASTALRAGRPLAPTLARQVGLMTQFCMLCRCIASGFLFGCNSHLHSEQGPVARFCCNLHKVL